MASGQARVTSTDTVRVGRLLIFAFIAYLGWLLMGEVEMSGSGPRMDGRHLVVETEDLEFRFDRFGSLSESYMVFGGNNDQMKNSLTHATLAALPISEARLIAQRYPTSTCASPPAPSRPSARPRP